MRKLHEKFLKSSLVKRLTLDEIEDYLTRIYRAKRVDKKEFEELKDDPFVDFDNIVFCYSITDEEVVNSLRSASEKKEMNQIKKLISQVTSISEREKKLALQAEETFTIILESSDHRYVDNITLQGESEKLLKEMIFLQGINPSECKLGNEDYEEYLKVLDEKGLL